MNTHNKYVSISQYSLEVPRGGASNEYTQHMFLLRNKKNIMWIPSYLELYNYQFNN